jgi:hypothetical protein
MKRANFLKVSAAALLSLNFAEPKTVLSKEKGHNQNDSSLKINIDCFDEIKTEKIKLSESTEIVNAIFQSYPYTRDSFRKYPVDHLHIAYFDTNPFEVIDFTEKYEFLEPSDSLGEYLKKINPKCYSELLLAMTFYDFESEPRWIIQNPFEKADYKHDTLLDHILRDTNGKLVYQEQHETILQIAGKLSCEEVKELRVDTINCLASPDENRKIKGMNSYKIKDMKWIDGRSIKEILDERSCYFFTRPPNHIAASLVWQRMIA